MKLTRLIETEERSVLTVMGPQHDKATGTFFCNQKKLTSLAGSPALVVGSFLCSNNKLTSLAGAPAHIGRDFYCNNNNLTSLVSSPAHVGGSFYCYGNELTSLAGSPAHISMDFYCYDNELTSLAGAPKLIDGGSFWCDDKLPLMRFLMTSTLKKLHDSMRCASIVNPYLKGNLLTRSEMLQLQQELIDSGFEEEAQL